ncbi:MAG: hypothetical protein WHT09_05725 [Thermogutta sp.]
MPDAAEIHGIVFQKASATLLARVLGADGNPITPSQITAARYSVALIDDEDPTSLSPVSGHWEVSLTPSAVVLATLQKDALWDVDEIGYNFRHILDVTQAPAFPEAQRTYRIEYRLTPQTGQQIVVRFRVRAI